MNNNIEQEFWNIYQQCCPRYPYSLEEIIRNSESTKILVKFSEERTLVIRNQTTTIELKQAYSIFVVDYKNL